MRKAEAGGEKGLGVGGVFYGPGNLPVLGPVLSSFLNFTALNMAFICSPKETLLTLVGLLVPTPCGLLQSPIYSQVLCYLVWTSA